MQTDKLTDINQKWLCTMPIKLKEVFKFREKIAQLDNQKILQLDDRIYKKVWYYSFVQKVKEN